MLSVVPGRSVHLQLSPAAETQCKPGLGHTSFQAALPTNPRCKPQQKHVPPQSVAISFYSRTPLKVTCSISSFMWRQQFVQALLNTSWKISQPRCGGSCELGCSASSATFCDHSWSQCLGLITEFPELRGRRGCSRKKLPDLPYKGWLNH